MRLANGMGSVTKMSGKRRKPYRVRITAGWEMKDGKAKQISKTIGYYATRKEALEALFAFNSAPYDLDTQGITFEELYGKWSAEHFKECAESTKANFHAAYLHCAKIYKMRMRDIRVQHLEGVIDACVSQTAKPRIKTLFNQMYAYAMRYEIVEKNYAEICKIPKQPAAKIERKIFTDEEIEKLRSYEQIESDIVLVGIYSGFRPAELLEIKHDDVHLDEGYMQGGMKTAAGKNRIVPIHSSIRPIIEKYYANGKEFLFSPMVTYNQYAHKFRNVCSTLGTKHTPHDTRHTFITMAKNAEMNDNILKLIVGHVVSDLTERVYTHRTLEQMIEEIEKIK